MAWSAEDAQARARSVPPGIWAHNLLARRAKAGSRDREKFSVKLICPAELRLMALWMVVRPKTTKRKGFVVLRYL